MIEPVFSFNLTPALWAALGASVVPLVWLLAVYCPRVYRVRRSIVRQSASMKRQAGDGLDKLGLTPVSVIVYAAGSPDALERLLPVLFDQEYPADMEVIVVSDGQNEDLRDAVARFRASNRGCSLYFTFAPDMSRNLSRKKLSVTLGVKAARYPVVVNVCDSTVIRSRYWLAAMCRKFRNQGVDLVIGCALPETGSDRARGHRFRAFSAAADAVGYLSAGLMRRPYRGDGHNLAYRRETFFANSGFGHSLNLQDGDDDIFVNEIAGARNTLVELSADSIAGIEPAGNPRAAWRREKCRRAFTARFLRKGSRRFFGFSSLMMWAWIAAASAAVASAWCNLFVVAVVVVEALALWLTVMIVWRRTLVAFGMPAMSLGIPAMLLRRPLSNFRFRIRARRSRSAHYTWVN